MIFGKKYDRAMKWLKEKNQDENHDIHSELEKKDLIALFLSAFLVFVPAIIIVLGIFALITWLI